MIRHGIIQALADFLVVDACHLCGRPYRGAATPAGDFRPALVAPAVVRVLGAVDVTAHPLCARCARGLVETEDSGWLPRVPVIAPFHTNATLLGIVHAVKFGRVTCLIPGLAAAISKALLARGMPRRPLLVPVPLDPAGRRRRGFNQAELIARELARRSGWELAPRALSKPRATRPQSLMAQGERVANVDKAFRAGPDPVAGRDVVLVDDLVTTGATASVCANVLRRSGGRVVAVACAGRAL